MILITDSEFMATSKLLKLANANSAIYRKYTGYKWHS